MPYLLQAKCKWVNDEAGNPIFLPEFECDAMIATPDSLVLGEVKTKVVPKDPDHYSTRLEKARYLSWKSAFARS